MKFARETQDGSAETKEDQISRKADFAPSPPLATSAKDAREEVPKSLITDH
jgi:hypothetical protein